MNRFHRLRLTVVMFALLANSVFAGNFQVDKKASVVAVDANASPPHSFTSVATDYQYDIDIDPKTLEVRAAQFSFKFEDLGSSSGKRDSKMRKWMNVIANPEARFDLKSVANRNGVKIGMGAFSMHGVSKDIEIPFSVERIGESIVLNGEVEFSYEDWGLEVIKLFVFRVKPEITPYFRLVGVLEN